MGDKVRCWCRSLNGKVLCLCPDKADLARDTYDVLPTPVIEVVVVEKEYYLDNYRCEFIEKKRVVHREKLRRGYPCREDEKCTPSATVTVYVAYTSNDEYEGYDIEEITWDKSGEVPEDIVEDARHIAYRVIHDLNLGII